MRQKLVYFDQTRKAPHALMTAVRWPQPQIVECFFATDPSWVMADHLLIAACRVPNYEGHGGQIDPQDKNQTARCEVVDLFVRYGVDLNARNNRKVSALHMACRFDLSEVAERLLSHGADPNPYDEARETPLYRAVNLGYAECVEVLLKHGAALDFVNRKKMTVLHRAVLRGKRFIVPVLLAAGADPNAIDKFGKKPLDYARNKHIQRALKNA